MGQPKVVEIVAAGSYSADELLRLAAALEGNSEHPLAVAIIERAGDLALPKASDFANLEGKGAHAKIEGKTVLVGNRLAMDEAGVVMGSLGEAAERLKGAGRRVSMSPAAASSSD